MQNIISALRIITPAPALAPPLPTLSHCLEKISGDQPDRQDFRRAFSKEVACAATDSLDSHGEKLPGLSDDDNIQPQIDRCIECCIKSRIQHVETQDFMDAFKFLFQPTCEGVQKLLIGGPNSKPVKLSGEGLDKSNNLCVEYRKGNIVLTNKTPEGQKTLLTLFLVTKAVHVAPPSSPPPLPVRARALVAPPVISPAHQAGAIQPPPQVAQATQKSIFLAVSGLMEEGNEKKGFESVITALTKVDKDNHVYSWLLYYQSRGVALGCHINLDSSAPQWTELREKLSLNDQIWGKAEKIFIDSTNDVKDSEPDLKLASYHYESLRRDNFPGAEKKCQGVKERLELLSK